MKPEEQARQDIDKKLEKANWLIQDRKDINLGADPGIAVREFPTKVGPVDYALFSNRKAVREKIECDRTDFWATTSNKQLNFVQHISISLCQLNL